jgi:hypothetical protein
MARRAAQGDRLARAAHDALVARRKQRVGDARTGGDIESVAIAESVQRLDQGQHGVLAALSCGVAAEFGIRVVGQPALARFHSRALGVVVVLGEVDVVDGRVIVLEVQPLHVTVE